MKEEVKREVVWNYAESNGPLVDYTIGSQNSPSKRSLSKLVENEVRNVI